MISRHAISWLWLVMTSFEFMQLYICYVPDCPWTLLNSFHVIADIYTITLIPFQPTGLQAISDAAIQYSDIDAVVASYCYGEPTCGQRAAYELGLTGIPIFNVNNNCSSGSSALMLARSLVKSGMNCVMALGKQLSIPIFYWYFMNNYLWKGRCVCIVTIRYIINMDDEN